MKILDQRNIGFLVIGVSLVLLIILGFVKAEIDKRDAFLCEVVHANPEIDAAQCPAHENNISWLMTLAFGIAFILLGIGLFFLFVSRKGISQSRRQFKEVDLSSMDKQQQRTYELLQNNEGSMYQSDLIKETGFTKVRMTRILDQMENKGIIERKRRGMTNIVILK